MWRVNNNNNNNKIINVKKKNMTQPRVHVIYIFKKQQNNSNYLTPKTCNPPPSSVLIEPNYVTHLIAA